MTNTLFSENLQPHTIINAKQDLKLNSTKLLRSAILQSVQDNGEIQPYNITIKELASLLGISPSNLYRDVECITDDIMNHPVYIRETANEEPTHYIEMPWISLCGYSAESGISLKLNKELRPLLVQLKQHYTQSMLETVLKMKSVYSIRVFELLLSRMTEKHVPANGTHIILSVQEIKEACACDNKYDSFSNFKVKVIDTAVTEINKTTNYNLSFTYKKNGKLVTGIDFLMIPKTTPSIDDKQLPIENIIWNKKNPLEQKLLRFLISLIALPLNDTENQQYRYEFHIATFCKKCGIDPTNGKNYENIRNAVKNLSADSFCIEHNGNKTFLHWFSSLSMKENSGKITITFSAEAMPYLLSMKKQFSQQELTQKLAMKSSYSIALYELLKSYDPQKETSVSIDIQDLRRSLAIPDNKYKEFIGFRRRVLEPSVKEINHCTDLIVTWSGYKQGRNYTSIIFQIKKQQ